ncbi:MAG: endo-1,4-beta-xylanase [Bacteroidia bacterium]
MTKSTILSILIIMIISLPGFAQNDAYHNALLNQLQNDYGLTGGTWVMTPNEATNVSNASSYGQTMTQGTATGQDFSTLITFNVANAGTNPWDAGYFVQNVNTVQQGDRLLLVVWLRANAGGNVPGQLSIFAENSSTYAKEIYLTVNPQSQWLQYFIPFESSGNFNAGQLNTGFHLAYQQQVIEMGGLAVINYGTSVPLSSLPSQLNNEFYPGSEPNAPWRAQAATRIEQHRKADMTIKVLDLQGDPIPNTPVRVEMLRHQFAFGTAVTPRRLAGNTLNDPTYQSKLTNLDGNGHGFNWVVTENALKWRAWEQGWAGTPAETVKGIKWLIDRNIKVRGHVLVWPGWQYMPDDMMSNQNDPAYLKNRINDRLNTILNYPGVRDKVQEWDVINEIVHVRDLENALMGTAGYPTGREIYPEIINQTLAEDPSLITYINDYNILSNGSVVGADYLQYKNFLQEVISAGAQLDGIGFQGHMGGTLVSPDSIYAILDDCYQTFGRTMKITEYDQSDIISDNLSAKYTGDFLTMVFSHPGVDGFLMWGFWDGAHWFDNAPLFEQNWAAKPALATFNDLLFNQWWTDSTLTTDANGELTLRGFKGDYRITTTYDSANLITELEVGQNVDTTIQLMLVGNEALLNAGAVRVFPNPVREFVVIELPYADQWEIQLINALGQEMLQTNVDGDIHRLDFSGFSAGVYYVKVNHKRNGKVVKRVMHLGN